MSGPLSKWLEKGSVEGLGGMLMARLISEVELVVSEEGGVVLQEPHDDTSQKMAFFIFNKVFICNEITITCKFSNILPFCVRQNSQPFQVYDFHVLS